jgi:hypothetical protein
MYLSSFRESRFIFPAKDIMVNSACKDGGNIWQKN